MSEVLTGVLFPQECAFLERVRKNIVHDYGMKDTVIEILGKADGGECKVIYEMKRPEGDFPESVEGMPRIQAAIERVDKVIPGGAEIDVDVYVPENTDAQKYVSLVKGLATAVALVRGTNFLFEVSIKSYGVKAKEDTFETQVIGSAIAKWMTDDEDFQFWKKTSSLYLGWFFEKPDFSKMGRDMISSVKEAIQSTADKNAELGTFVLKIRVYEALIKKSFFEVTGGNDMEPMEISMGFMLESNPAWQASRNLGEGLQLEFAANYSRENSIKEPLINFQVTIYRPLPGYHRNDVASDYQRAVTIALIPYMEMWLATQRPANLEYKTTIKTK